MNLKKKHFKETNNVLPTLKILKLEVKKQNVLNCFSIHLHTRTCAPKSSTDRDNHDCKSTCKITIIKMPCHFEFS